MLLSDYLVIRNTGSEELKMDLRNGGIGDVLFSGSVVGFKDMDS